MLVLHRQERLNTNPYNAKMRVTILSQGSIVPYLKRGCSWLWEREDGNFNNLPAVFKSLAGFPSNRSGNQLGGFSLPKSQTPIQSGGICVYHVPHMSFAMSSMHLPVSQQRLMKTTQKVDAPESIGSFLFCCFCTRS